MLDPQRRRGMIAARDAWGAGSALPYNLPVL